MPNLPCNLSWSTLLGEAISCATGSCTLVDDIFEACCPKGDGFGACAQPFLTALNELNQKKIPITGKSLADVAFSLGFNTKVCALNPRIPHLGLLGGGDPNGNIKNCVGTLNLTPEAKTWIGNCVKGDPVVNYSTDSSGQRYRSFNVL